MTIFRSFKNMYLKPENEIKMFIHQFERMVAGFRCCQTWIQHPIQSDHARPRSDLHPHIFATKARWRGIAQPLCPATATAHLPNVLARATAHWSVNPAIGSWTSRRSFFLKMDEHGWLPSSIFPSSKVLPTRKLRRSASLEPKTASGNSRSKRVTRQVRFQNSNPNPTHPALQIEVNPHGNIIPSDFFEAWLVRFVSWARQLPQLQCVKWHKTSRVWNFI